MDGDGCLLIGHLRVFKSKVNQGNPKEAVLLAFLYNPDGKHVQCPHSMKQLGSHGSVKEGQSYQHRPAQAHGDGV